MAKKLNFQLGKLFSATPLLFMRRTGSSAELLTREQQAQIDRHMNAQLHRYNCDFPYDKIFGTLLGGKKAKFGPVQTSR
jgi:hypothetical protein